MFEPANWFVGEGCLGATLLSMASEEHMRVAMFASGNVGRDALQLTLAHPKAEVRLVGLAADGDPTANRDIRQLAGSVPCIELTRTVPEAILAELRGFDLELIVLAWWPYILKADLLAVPSIGCINFHPGFLPHCRGMTSNFWAIVEQRPYGVTLHLADASVDGGDIAFQMELPVTWEDTGATLLDRAMSSLVRLYDEHLDEILAGRIGRRPQSSGGSLHRRSELDPVSQIHLDEPTTPRQLLNLLRARMLSPANVVDEPGGAWFVDGDECYEVRVSIRRRQ